MPSTSLVDQIRDLLAQVWAMAEACSGWLGEAQRFILDNFGQNGLYAAYIAAAVLVLVIVIQIAKMAFATIKYLVIPALALALLASLVLPLSFSATLPASVTLCSLFLLFKG